jgi:hypothetical protein
MASFFQGLKNKFKKRDPEKKLTLEDCVSEGILTDEEFLRLLKDRAVHKWEVKMIELRNKDKKKV